MSFLLDGGLILAMIGCELGERLYLFLMAPRAHDYGPASPCLVGLERVESVVFCHVLLTQMIWLQTLYDLPYGKFDRGDSESGDIRGNAGKRAMEGRREWR